MDQERTVALIRRGRAIAGEMTSLKEELGEIVAELKASTPIGFKLDVDGVPATKRKGNRTFSSLLAIAQFSAEEKKTCLVTEPRYDDGLIRALAEAKNIVDSCMIDPDEEKAQFKLM